MTRDVTRDAADFAAALDRAGTAARTGRDPARMPENAARSAPSSGLKPGRPVRTRLRRRAALSSIVLVAGLLIGGALTEGPLFAMQGRGPASARARGSDLPATPQTADAVEAQLARAGVARWVGVAQHEGAPQLVVFADLPAHASTIRQALSSAGVSLPVRVMGESAVLAEVNAFLRERDVAAANGGSTAALRASTVSAAGPRADRLRAVGAGPGRIRIAGMVDSRADAAAVLARLRSRFPALKAIECDLASDADARQIVSPLLRGSPSGTGPEDVASHRAADIVTASGEALTAPAFGEDGAGLRVLIDAAPAALAVLERRIAAAAVAQNQVLAVALRHPATGRHPPVPRMIVMGPRPYAVLANGATVFEGDALGDAVVARIERDAIRLLPPAGGAT